jgi:hypothetical protein
LSNLNKSLKECACLPSTIKAGPVLPGITKSSRPVWESETGLLEPDSSDSYKNVSHTTIRRQLNLSLQIFATKRFTDSYQAGKDRIF